MLLPQSGAFTTLRTRLNSVSSMGILNLMPKDKKATPGQKLPHVDFDALLKHFVSVQQAHQDARKKALSYRTTRAASQAITSKPSPNSKDPASKGSN